MQKVKVASFEEARRRAGALNRLPPRLAPIAVGRVVGSADAAKAASLRPDFLSRRHGALAPRYRAVERAMRAGILLPAIEVYGLGGAYYVLDGHHRVAAARALGQLYLDALVHEFPLPADGAGDGLVAGEARRRDERPALFPAGRARLSALARRVAATIVGGPGRPRPA